MLDLSISLLMRLLSGMYKPCICKKCSSWFDCEHTAKQLYHRVCRIFEGHCVNRDATLAEFEPSPSRLDARRPVTYVAVASDAARIAPFRTASLSKGAASSSRSSTRRRSSRRSATQHFRQRHRGFPSHASLCVCSAGLLDCVSIIFCVVHWNQSSPATNKPK